MGGFSVVPRDRLLLKQYTQKFVECAVDGSLLVTLTAEELENDLGITNRLHRKKLIMGLKQLPGALVVALGYPPICCVCVCVCVYVWVGGRKSAEVL